jgi:hypothetical protein
MHRAWLGQRSCGHAKAIEPDSPGHYCGGRVDAIRLEGHSVNRFRTDRHRGSRRPHCGGPQDNTHPASIGGRCCLDLPLIRGGLGARDSPSVLAYSLVSGRDSGTGLRVSICSERMSAVRPPFLPIEALHR